MSLPIRLEPEAAEGWSSYLARVARLIRCRQTALERQLELSAYAVTIREHGAQAAARMLNITPQQVRAMHLESLDGIAFDLTTCLATGGVSKRPWTWLHRPRTCPQCAVEGRSEPLVWRLPWITACLTHKTYLADARNGGVPGPAHDRSLLRTEQFTDLLAGGSMTLIGHELAGNEALDLWRASIQLALAARQLEGTSRRASLPKESDSVLDIVHPLVFARDEQSAGQLVHLWCQAAGISRPYRSAFERVRHPLVRRVLGLG